MFNPLDIYGPTPVFIVTCNGSDYGFQFYVLDYHSLGIAVLDTAKPWLLDLCTAKNLPLPWLNYRLECISIVL